MLPSVESVSGLRSVHFHQSNSSRVTHAAYDGGVVTSWQTCNDGRLSQIHGSVTAVDDLLNLAPHDYASDYRSLPIVVGSKHSSGAIVQFQCWIEQNVRNTELSELRAESTNDHGLTFGSLNNEATNHHVVICLNKRASADIGEDRCWGRRRRRPRCASRSGPRCGSCRWALGVAVAVGLGVAVAVGLGVGVGVSATTVLPLGPTVPSIVVALAAFG